MKQSKIIGAGHYLPERVVTNHDLEKLMDTNDQWIQERTGIKERHFRTVGVDTTWSMGVEASKVAIQRAGISADDIDLIVFATISSDYFFPGPGVFVQKALTKRTIPALDIRNQCSGFIYGLSVADQFIKTGMYKTILLIGSEVQSVALDLTTRGRNVSVIFGDGAGAVVLTASDEKGKGVLSTHLHSQGEHAEQLFMRDPGTSCETRMYPGITENADAIYPYMNGNFVFKNAVVRFEEAIMEALTTNNLGVSDINMIIPHQANLRITEFIRHRMKMPEDKVYSNIQRVGNTTAASIPICLSELWEQGRIKENELWILAAFGSGFTWASAAIRW